MRRLEKATMSRASSTQSLAKSNSTGSGGSGEKKEKPTAIAGWLQKWTNYIKGYRQRWFVLDDKRGTLSYYRNQAEVGHTCRGAINLQEARIHTENAYNFIVSGSTQTFHLKAASEVERQKWVTGLELVRHRAIKAAESDEDEELKIEADEMGHNTDVSSSSKSELGNALKMLEGKMDDLRTCQELIAKHGSQLLKSLAEFETSSTAGDVGAKVKTINERATLFRITTNAMINACNEFVGMGQSHSKKWSRLLQHEHQQRIHLQDQLEQLARQHSSLERQAIKERASSDTHPTKRAPYADSDEEQFHDAAEDVQQLDDDDAGTTSRQKLNRQGSQASCEARDEGRSNKERPNYDFLENLIINQDGPPTDHTTAQPPTPEKSRRVVSVRQRRTEIPPRPQVGLNLWSIMRNCIGKELSKIPMPVNFNEPLSVLQRITEDLEYADLLDRAASKTDSTEQMCYVAAYTISSYSTTGHRATKPFNPLLGETYECDRSEDLGWRSFAEQVSHHPPAAAQYAEGKEWNFYQDFTMTSKFRGKYLSVIPIGQSHLDFPKSGNHYTWRKVTTTVHNIIVGKLWVDNHGDMTIENHKTGDKCHLKLIPYSYFSRDVPRKVTGVVQDKDDVVRWVLQGTWDDHMDMLKVTKGTQSGEKSDKSVFETLPARRIWNVNPPYPSADKMYHFTKLAIELNEEEEGVAPTDSRVRPDQRLMELGRWDESNQAKLKIEEKQRVVRRQREAEAEQAMLEGRPYKEYEPTWFRKTKDEFTGGVIHMYKGEYWKCKEAQKWDRCPNIF